MLMAQGVADDQELVSPDWKPSAEIGSASGNPSMAKQR